MQNRKPWFSRDEKISEQLQANRKWAFQVKADLLKCKQELEEALLRVTPDIQEVVSTEVCLMSTRIQAIKLVLSEVDDERSAQRVDTAEIRASGSTGSPTKTLAVPDAPEEKKATYLAAVPQRSLWH